MKVSNQQIRELLTRGVVDIVGREALERKLLAGKKLRIKFGVDVARPDIHLGHAVGLRKLREFQDLGHKVIFLIGDATTRIGDPTGKDKTRPLLTEREIKANAKTYIAQAGKVLDLKKTEIRRNSEWFDKMSMLDFVKLMTMVTHSQLITREAFQKRIAEGQEIFAHELIYPLMQGYDSVVLKADLALHADQLFNEHFGRSLQEKFGQEPQAIMTLPILAGLDGKQKMSKSLDNCVGLTEAPDAMYGKLMSLPDEAIADYFTLCTDLTVAEIEKIRTALAEKTVHPVKSAEGGAKQFNRVNPRDLKMRLARRVVEIYHGAKKAAAAEQEFVRVFQKKDQPDKVTKIKVVPGSLLADVLLAEKMIASKSDFRRLIAGGGIQVNDEKLNDPNYRITENILVRVGRLKFLEIKL
ncbi:MAG: tyrosine--tRNA ligase [Candidatus Niyogibacteria bacterium]|nr:tyrosine--tRNA ligase [Candidatus Niyogibacteria bacterium]